MLAGGSHSKDHRIIHENREADGPSAANGPKKYLEARKHGPKLHHGQQSLKQLKQHGAALSNIEITDANIAAFKPCAKKYGVDFTLRKDKTIQPPHYIVIFKSRDADNLEQAFKEFTAKKLSREAKPPSARRCPSCGKRLADASQKMLHFMDSLAAAFANGLPSFHPFDLCIGIVGAALVRLAVYMKGKNAKKYRHGMEYGSARFGNAKCYLLLFFLEENS